MVQFLQFTNMKLILLLFGLSAILTTTTTILAKPNASISPIATDSSTTTYNCPQSGGCQLFAINLYCYLMKLSCIQLITAQLNPRCKEIHYSFNQLSHLPNNVFKTQITDNLGLSKIILLDLSYNKLVQIEQGAFTGLDSLETLSLNSNELTKVPTSAFIGLHKLKFLNLDRNTLETIPRAAFEPLISLETLQLSDCQITNIAPEAFIGLKNLLSLDLSSNSIITISGNGLAGMPKLNSLKLPRNYTLLMNATNCMEAFGITTTANIASFMGEDYYEIPCQCNELNQLVSMDTKQPLTYDWEWKFGSSDTSLKCTKKLQTSTTTTTTTTPTPALGKIRRTIELEQNVGEFEQNEGGATKFTLMLRGRKDTPSSSSTSSSDAAAASSTPSYNCKQNGCEEFIFRLYCYLKHLTCIPLWTAPLGPYITKLYYESNQLTQLPSNVFRTQIRDGNGLSKIIEIDLSFNKLVNIEQGAFDGIDSLETLNLAANQLTIVPSSAFIGLHKLKLLKLNANLIRDIPRAAFEPLGALQRLDLSFCQISIVQPEAFIGLKSLLFLDLSLNSLITIPEYGLIGMPKLNSLNLNGNHPEFKSRNINWMKAFGITTTTLNDDDEYEEPFQFNTKPNEEEVDYEVPCRCEQLSTDPEHTLTCNWIWKFFKANTSLECIGQPKNTDIVFDEKDFRKNGSGKENDKSKSNNIIRLDLTSSSSPQAGITTSLAELDQVLNQFEKPPAVGLMTQPILNFFLKVIMIIMNAITITLIYWL